MPATHHHTAKRANLMHHHPVRRHRHLSPEREQPIVSAHRPSGRSPGRFSRGERFLLEWRLAEERHVRRLPEMPGGAEPAAARAGPGPAGRRPAAPGRGDAAADGRGEGFMRPRRAESVSRPSRRRRRRSLSSCGCSCSSGSSGGGTSSGQSTRHPARPSWGEAGSRLRYRLAITEEALGDRDFDLDTAAHGSARVGASECGGGALAGAADQDGVVRRAWRECLIVAAISTGVMVAIVSLSGMTAREFAVMGLVIVLLASADQLDRGR
jgi:hypothetical protein